MDSAELIFTNSPWWIAIAILVGIGYASLLYSKKGPWNNFLKKVLFGLRTLAIALIILLLINPMLRRSVNTTVKPIAVLLFDNSSSIPSSIGKTATSEAFNKVNNIQQSLSEQGYDVKLRTLTGEVSAINDITYSHETSNLSGTIADLPKQYNAKDLALAVLISDGIYNQGVSPDYKNFRIPVHTLGVGDTIPKKDIILKNVRYNKIAYLDNQFPIEAEILQNGFNGVSASVKLRKNGLVVQTKNVSFDQNRSFHTVNFLVAAEKADLNRFTVEIDKQTGEQSSENNIKNLYIDVINNKDKILLLASAPHPDIKVIKRVLEANKNYEVFDYIPGINDYKDEQYSLVIAHQPFAGNTGADRQLNRLKENETPIWYIAGKKTNLAGFNQFNNTIEILQSRGQYDNVGGALNSSFGKFTMEEVDNNTLAELPPIEVPYGNSRLKAPSEVLLFQKIGSINSDRPLLVVNNNTEVKEAVMLGSGFWTWRILEASRNEETPTFNNIFSKLIQYLNTKEDKRKFRVATSKDEYNDSENVVFNTDVYNDIYEKIYNIPVELKVTDEKGQSNTYSYITSQGNSDYQIGRLTPGAYRYTATTTLNKKKVSVSGGFSVIKLQIESVNLTADFNVLKRIADKTGGTFSTVDQIDQLQTNLSETEAKGVLYSEENYSQLVELRWLLLLITALITTEWFIRKFSGGY
ncbi:MAG: VWA domain-containing protein [Bacteroidota bacterium]